MTSDPAASPPPGVTDGATAPSAASRDVVQDLRTLGLAPGATWEDICRAHARLVADLTPGPDASHRNVALAETLLDEVNAAFSSLRFSSVA